MLELESVSKIVAGQKHIKETSLTLKTGHFNVLLGNTGAGKTSLIKLIAGLDSVASGTIRMNNKDITRVSTQLRGVSLVHQFFVNYPHMTVYENIASPLRVARIASSEIEGRIFEVAKILKLVPMLGRYPHELSGGQQQRTALARAIVKQSQIVLLDEPLANLDYKLREELRELLPELFADRGAVVVYATSEPEEALLLGGKTALMDDGSVRQFGQTAQIYRKPNSLLAAQIFSDPPINCAKIQKQGKKFRLGEMQWTLPKKFHDLSNDDYHIAIRAHHVLPYKTKHSTASLKGRVGIAELSGSNSSAHFTFGQYHWVSLAHGTHVYNSGEEYTFFLNLEECLFFTLDGLSVA